MQQIRADVDRLWEQRNFKELNSRLNAVDAADKEGNTSLHLVSHCGIKALEISNLLLDYGADTNISLCLANARDVLEAGAMELIVVHFPSGSVAITTGKDPIITPSVRVPKSIIAGTNGAGDAFASGVLYGLHQGWALELSLELAHASAAASMRRIGTTDAIEAWSECLSLAEVYGLNPKPGQLQGL